jgi:hypothetical protein
MRWPGPIWSWPATFLLGRARASGSALFNTLGAFGGFVVRARARPAPLRARRPSAPVCCAWRGQP